MSSCRRFPILVALAAVAALVAVAAPAAAAKQTIKGAAILDHACGKVSVKNMGLIHDGKIDEAMKLGTPEMQAQWKAMSADDRKMMVGMMKETSQSEADFSAEIKKNGVLEIDGNSATMTITKTTKDATGSGTETMTQNFVITGATCAITH